MEEYKRLLLRTSLLRLFKANSFLSLTKRRNGNLDVTRERAVKDGVVQQSLFGFLTLNSLRYLELGRSYAVCVAKTGLLLSLPHPTSEKSPWRLCGLAQLSRKEGLES